jgi:FkbH-like protein
MSNLVSNLDTALITQAQADMRAGRLDQAEAAWREILASRPEAQTAAFGLIRILDDRGDRAEAEAALRAFTEAAPGSAAVQAAARQWAAWQDTPAAGAKPIRIALTGTGTLAPLGAFLRVACAQIGLHPALYVSEFGQWAQDLLPLSSPLYKFAPELIILTLDPAALFPRTLSPAALTTAEAQAEREAGMAQVAETLAATERNAPTATILLHTFALPDYAPLGILDLKSADGQRARLETINQSVVALVREKFPRVALFDQERVEARHGKARVRDDRLWYMASMPYSDSFLPVMASEYLRYLRPLKGLTRKCLVLDLDNTLWGGVIGEDGPHQIKIGGTSAPGNAFADFQSVLEGLNRRGILLALCSKNNPDDVWPVFETHPDMILRRPHFAAARINWQDKATNLREIARELNLGLDSLVFLDDNPAERGLVRQELPEVLTPEMPRDPALYTRLLLGLDVFETLALTEEDTRRAQLYQEQSARKALEESLIPAEGGGPGDLSEYLTALQMTVHIAEATPFTLPRIAQLINKTNQFNLTTRRYTEAQVQAMALASSEWGVYSVSVADRFGDSGLTGVALVRKAFESWEIDTFLLSCRVLGRGVEDALLTYVENQACLAGASELRGVFLPTSKNAPAAAFYAKQGFRQGADESLWALPLDTPRPYPAWLTITETEEKNFHD